MDIDDIKLDNLSGAAEILRRAAAVVLDHSRTDDPESLQKLGLKLIEAQPRMAPLFNLINAVLLAESEGRGGGIEAVVRDYLNEHDKSEEAVVRECELLIRGAHCVGTYSRSSTVIKALIGAWEAGCKFRVLLSESRPMMEGRRAAEELVRIGVSVTVMVDAGLDEIVRRSDLILFGADAFSSVWLTNKIGTSLLVLAARAHATPAYAVATTHKLLPDRINLPEEIDHDAAQIWSRPPAGITLWNRYFERIPVERVRAVITEMGQLDPAAIRRLENQVRIAPLLADRFR